MYASRYGFASKVRESKDFDYSKHFLQTHYFEKKIHISQFPFSKSVGDVCLCEEGGKRV